MKADYRFSILSYSIRKENSNTYAFSIKASEELTRNDDEFQYPDDMWDDFWEELQQQFEENQL